MRVKYNYARTVFDCDADMLDDARMNNIARIRKARGLRQGDLAEMVGISQPHISRIEGGEEGGDCRVLRLKQIIKQTIQLIIRERSKYFTKLKLCFTRHYLLHHSTRPTIMETFHGCNPPSTVGRQQSTQGGAAPEILGECDPTLPPKTSNYLAPLSGASRESRIEHLNVDLKP